MAANRSTKKNCPASQVDAASSSANLLTFIDGWIRDPAIRAFILAIIAMVLLGLALIFVLASGAISAFITAVLPSVAPRVTAAVVSLAATGGGIWLYRRKRIRRSATITPPDSYCEPRDPLDSAEAPYTNPFKAR